MSTLLELAARVEVAEGASRELDAEIFRAIGAPLPQQFLGRGVSLNWDAGQSAFVMPVGGLQIRYDHPAFTASLDAALTLVGGKPWSISPQNAAGALPWYAQIMDTFEASAFDVISDAESECPIRALAAAALKALASLHAEKVET